MDKVNEGVPPSNNELKDYLDQRGAYGGIIRETHTSNFYKMKYEELKEENEKLKKHCEEYTYSDDYVNEAEEENKELKEENTELKQELDLTEFYDLIPWDKDRSMCIDDIKNYIMTHSSVPLD
jgi:FtsZ-binding cell division protein ZapB